MNEGETKIFRAIVIGLVILFTALFTAIAVDKYTDMRLASKMIAKGHSPFEIACAIK